MGIVATDQVDIRMIKELTSLISEAPTMYFAIDIGEDIHYKIPLTSLATLIKELIMTDRIKSEKGISIKADELTTLTFKDDSGNPSPFEGSAVNIFINAFAVDGYRVEMQPLTQDANGFTIQIDQDLTLSYTAIYVPNAV